MVSKNISGGGSVAYWLLREFLKWLGMYYDESLTPEMKISNSISIS
jgi:hypothetical protein